MFPRVKFSVRRPAGDGRWFYENVDMPAPGGAAFTPLEHVPAPGDLVSLWTRTGPIEGGPAFRVLERWWSYPGWGSADFPYGQIEPSAGPLLDVIVEPADGLYRDEADICAETECSAVMMFGDWKPTDPNEAPEPHEHRKYEG